MKIEDILDMWQVDCKIKMHDIAASAEEIPRLHAKYIRLLTTDRLLLVKYQKQYEILKFDKTVFYLEGPTQQQLDVGWEYPAKGKILRAELQIYMNSDKQIIEMQLKIAQQQEKINLVESIITQINNRSFYLNNIIEWKKFNNCER